MKGGWATNGQIFSSVHDPLYACARLLDNDSTKVSLIGLDAGGVPDDNESD